MIPESALPAELLSYRPHVLAGYALEPRAASYPAPALLIQVPLVPPRVRPARRPSAAATERIRAHGASSFRGRTRRRRLRREMRVAGCVLATALPLALAVALLRGVPAVGGDADRPDARSRIAAEVRPPVVSITLDPTTLNPLAEPESTVELPGYLLPDEGSEEPVHEGG